MAGERHALLSFTFNAPQDGQDFSICVGGAYQKFTAYMLGPGHNTPGPDEFELFPYTNPTARESNGVSIREAIIARLAQLSLVSEYQVSVLYDAPTGVSLLRIEVTGYDDQYNFEPLLVDPDNPANSPTPGFYEASRLTPIRPIFVDYTVIDCKCFGTNTGLIDLNVTGGLGPGSTYTYEWADGPTSEDRGAVPAGRYTVKVTATNGVYEIVEIGVGQNTPLVLEIRKQGDSLLVVASGGTPGYTFDWGDGVTTALHAGLEPGEYSCTVRDSLGCGASITATVEPFRFYFSHDPISLALDAGDDYRDDPTTKPELSFVCEVFVEKGYLSEEWVPVGQPLEQPADQDGRTVFEVQELLEPYVQGYLPAPGSALVERADTLFRRFYLRYQERTADGLLGDEPVTLSYNFVVHGGLSFEQAGLGTWFKGYQTQVLPFFTWEPQRKKVLVDQPEYLFWMAPSFTLNTYKCCLQLFRADGTSEVRTFQTLTDVQRFELYCLPVGFTQRQLPAGVVRWEAYVTDEFGVLQSERRTYVLDRKTVPTRRYFLYTNSLGGLNTLCSRGRAEQQLTTKTQSSEVPRVAGYDPVQGDVQVDRKTGLPLLKAYTGSRSAEQLLADQDFMLAERVVLLEQGRYRAGTVKDRSFTFLDEDETRRVLQFDFELPRERHYTPHLQVTNGTILLPPSDV